MDEEFDKLKTKVLKYIVYKKRTEREVLQKFFEEDGNLLNEVIEYLKEAEYLNDNLYIDKAVKDFINLNNLSVKEIEYKLTSKGLKRSLISDYIYNNREMLVEYELNSAEKIVAKKKNNYDVEELKAYLSKKGYMPDIIKTALEKY